MNHDYRLGFPGLLALIEPEAKPAKPQVWPFPLKSSDPFETEEWTHVGVHLYGAAQAPQSESSRDKPAASSGSVETPEAAPPSGQWVLTSERKPPKAGVYFVKVPVGRAQQREWTGMEWRWIDSDGQPAERWGKADCHQGWAWLDTSPATPKADAEGWIKWGGGKCPVPGGSRVDIKWKSGRISLDLEAGPDGEAWGLGMIDYYRLVPQ